MNRVQVWQRLLWKDFVLVRPLLIAVLGVIVAWPLMILLLSLFADMSHQTAIRMAMMLWILLPNLMALGAPAMIVGTEEEAGTLSWLRTLPVRWQRVADSKFLIAMMSVIFAWLLASFALWVTSLMWPPTGSSLDSFTSSFTSWASIGQSVFFTIALLLCGFVTAYLIRSPVGGLVALVPLVLAVSFLMVWIANKVMGDSFGSYWPGMRAPVWRWILLVLAELLVLVAVFFAQRWLAKRRLSMTEFSIYRHIDNASRKEAYRPPAAISLLRPSRAVAMLWQQWRQVRWPVIGMISVVGLFILMSALNDKTRDNRLPVMTMTDFTVPLTVLALIWLGAMTFYGDSVRRRCAFYADRGISRTTVWWTRLLPTFVPAIALIAVSVAVLTDKQNPFESQLSWTAFFFLLYAFGVLVSQWSKRPILSFFAAPAYAGFTMSWLGVFMMSYVSYVWAVLLATPVVLLATRRLTGRWLDGRLDRGFTFRVIGWTGIAIALPMITVLAIRWSGTPPMMKEWRATMTASEVTPPTRPGTRWSGGQPYSPNISITAMQPTSYADEAIDEDIDGRLEDELADEKGVGRHVTFIELRALINGRGTDEQVRTATEVLLKWSRRVREMVVAGEEGLPGLMTVAEPAEQMAKRRMAVSGDEFTNKLPSEELRRQARRTAVIAEWKNYQRQGWDDISGYPTFKSFADGYVLNQLQNRNWIEQNRADRNIDRMTKLLLDQINSDELFRDPAVLKEWRDAWNEAQSGPRADQSGYHELSSKFSNWVENLRW